MRCTWYIDKGILNEAPNPVFFKPGSRRIWSLKAPKVHIFKKCTLKSSNSKKQHLVVIFYFGWFEKKMVHFCMILYLSPKPIFTPHLYHVISRKPHVTLLYKRFLPYNILFFKRKVHWNLIQLDARKTTKLGKVFHGVKQFQWNFIITLRKRNSILRKVYYYTANSNLWSCWGSLRWNERKKPILFSRIIDKFFSFEDRFLQTFRIPVQSQLIILTHTALPRLTESIENENFTSGS